MADIPRSNDDPYYQRAFKRRDAFSVQASENGRKLGLAGLALVLLLGGVASDGFDPNSPADLPGWLLAAGVLLVLSLLLDALHYVAGSVLFGWWGRREERRIRIEGEPQSPGWPPAFPIVLWIMFGLKMGAVSLAYGVLLVYLAQSFF